ncbi:hypothetical protein GCM10025331_15630 [Actinoplanes utahensis]|nr:hypothetical protein Aut01nite_22830 [Actinoplanes utahensis]
MGRDGARRSARAEQAHGPGRRIDEHRVIVSVEDDDTDPQRVETLPADSFQAVLTRRAIIVRFDGGAPLRGTGPTRLARSAYPGEHQSRSDTDGERGRNHAGGVFPLHAAIVGSLFT